MRLLLPTLAAFLMAAPAFAGSIATVSCSTCPALKPRPQSETYHVDAIAPGTQKIEIREENGQRKIYRTEAWMGGSPVTFVSTAPAEAAATADAAAGDRVDTQAHTGALDTTVTEAVSTAAATPSREFDPAGFALRLD